MKKRSQSGTHWMFCSSSRGHAPIDIKTLIYFLMSFNIKIVGLWKLELFFHVMIKVARVSGQHLLLILRERVQVVVNGFIKDEANPLAGIRIGCWGLLPLWQRCPTRSLTWNAPRLALYLETERKYPLDFTNYKIGQIQGQKSKSCAFNQACYLTGFQLRQRFSEQVPASLKYMKCYLTWNVKCMWL